MTTPQCLSLEQLETLARSDADDQGSAEYAHLEKCASCREKLDEIRANLALLDEYQQAALDIAKLERSPIELDPQALPGSSPTIPGYEILEEIHRGAQGVVYKATQRSTKRVVALKVLLHGPYASRRQKHRFEREIEIVATLEHTHIVRLYESGQSDDRHYFVMQYIDGTPLDEYVRTHLVGEREILELFVKICRAVAYAHQRGIIHRDLKPSNIRVDRAGEPHVLDFGLAKPIDAIRKPDPFATQAGEFFGTFAYASPEQVSGKPESIDTRTDAYALGVILYELLTRHRPYRTEDSITKTLASITEADPVRPSSRNRRINDELNRLILKALAKDPDRRYASAGALAGDIERYLAGLPIEAKSDSGWYLLRKSLARHKALAMFVAALAMVINVALFVSLAYWRDAAEQRDRAVAAEQLAREQRDTAQTARAAEQQQRLRAEQQAESLRRTSYLQRIALAQSAAENYETNHLLRLLNECPPDLRSWEWYRLRWLVDRSEKTLSGHSGFIRSLSISPDGTRFLTASDDGTCRIWDPTTGENLLTLLRKHGKEHVARSAVYSPDGKRIASCGSDGSIRIWAPDSGEDILTIHAAPVGTAGSAVFSPDGERILAAFCDGTFTVWNAATGQRLLANESFHPAHSTAIAISPDGKSVLVRWGINSITELDAHTGEIRWEYHDVIDGAALAYSPDSSRFAVPGSGGVAVFDRKTHQEIRRIQEGLAPIKAVAFPPDGALLATGDGDGTIRLWHVNSNVKPKTLPGHTAEITSIRFTPDGKKIVSVSADATCKIWDPLLPIKKWTWEADCYVAAISPDGKRIVAGGPNRTVTILDRHKPGSPRRTLLGHESEIYAVAFSMDGRRVFSADTHKPPSVRAWDADTGAALFTARGHEDGIPCLAVLPDGKRIITGSWDKTARVWDVITGKQLAVLPHNDEVWDLAVSPDGKWIATGCKDHLVYLWDARTYDLIRTQAGHTGAVDALAFSPDSTRLVTGGADQTLRLWDVATGQMIRELAGHAGTIYSAVFTPDGKRIVTGHSRNISLWDVETGRQVMAFEAHAGSIFSLAFSRADSDLLSAEDGRFKIWPIVPDLD